MSVTTSFILKLPNKALWSLSIFILEENTISGELFEDREDILVEFFYWIINSSLSSYPLYVYVHANGLILLQVILR